MSRWNPEPAANRVLARVEVADCWLFAGYQNSRGYGIIEDNGSKRVAHRVVWEALVGPVSEGLELDHLCRVRHCVNPDHLEPVTHRENMRRGLWRTHCKYGHPRDTRYGDQRSCSMCRPRYNREAYQRRQQRRREGGGR